MKFTYSENVDCATTMSPIPFNNEKKLIGLLEI